MPAIHLPYIDDHIEDQRARLADGRAAGFWRALHWGLFPDPQVVDDDPDRYMAAAEALTERIVAVAGIGDGTRVLDVGCGFGGTLDHVAGRHPECRLVGLNIDERQLRQARVLLAAEGRAAGTDTPLVTADACRLPLATGTVGHVLAIECVFHFPSRKAFLKEVARVLAPGGTLALSDFVFAEGAFGQVAANMMRFGLGKGSFYGSNKRPVTSTGYARLGRAVGLDVVVDDDVTEATLPTYAALRRIYEDAGQDEAVQLTSGCEQLARAGGWEYHVVAFRKRDDPAPPA